MSKPSQEWRSKSKTQAALGAGGAGPSPGPADGVGEYEGVIRFAPENVVRGIVFHMLEEGLARDVEAASLERTLVRMRRRDLRPAIRHTAWLAMSNHDRLEWLLAESRTVPLIHPNDVVSLDGRDED